MLANPSLKICWDFCKLYTKNATIQTEDDMQKNKNKVDLLELWQGPEEGC